MLKFLKGESKTLISAAAIVGVFSFASRVMGLVRDRILAGTFGAGYTLDVYYAAFKIPDFLFNLIVVGALSASFIPIFTKLYANGTEKNQAWKFTNNTLHLIGAALLLVVCFVVLFANPLSTLIAPGFSSEKQAAVAQFMRILIFAQFFLSVSLIYGSVLQSLRRFFLYSLAPIFYNLGIIIGAVLFTKWFGTIGLALGVVFGALLHVVSQWWGLRETGYTYRFLFDWKDPHARKMIKLTGPRMIGIGMNQILFFLLTVIATMLGTGSVTIFQFAYNIEFFPVGIFGVSYAIAAFPAFSEYLSNLRLKDFQDMFVSTVKQIVFFLVPMTVVFLLLRAQLVRLVVGAGAFDWYATVKTADTLAIFALVFIPQSLVYVLARAFFALHDTATPLVAGFTAAILGLVSGFYFSSAFGVIGLAIAFAIAECTNAVLLWVLLRQKVGSLGEMDILKSFSKMVGAGIVAAAVIQFSKIGFSFLFDLSSFIKVFVQTALSAGFGLLAYVSMLHVLRSEELASVISSLTRKQLKAIKPIETIGSNDGQQSA